MSQLTLGTDDEILKSYVMYSESPDITDLIKQLRPDKIRCWQFTMLLINHMLGCSKCTSKHLFYFRQFYRGKMSEKYGNPIWIP